MSIKFSEYGYYPALRIRAAELEGLENIDSARRDKIVPLLTLGQWRGSSDLSTGMDKCVAANRNKPFLLDLTTDSRKIEDQWNSLRSPTDDFKNWLDFSRTYKSKGAIPVVLLPSGARVREVVQQACAIEEEYGSVAFRVQDFAGQTPLVISAISSLKDPNSAIVFIDCQYIRDAMAAYVAAAISTINRLRTEFPRLLISVLSTSFPSSTLQFADAMKMRGTIGMLERDFHSRIGGDRVAIYGDHGSIHAVVYDDVPAVMKWSPRIDFPEYTSWYFERRQSTSNAQAYSECAKAILGIYGVAYDMENSNIWGEQKIVEAAHGDPYGKSPAKWISVRVNIHISRQIDYKSKIDLQMDEDYEE